jgi:hypothetical protein
VPHVLHDRRQFGSGVAALVIDTLYH